MIAYEDLTAFTPENLKKRCEVAKVVHLRVDDERACCLLKNGEYFWAESFSAEQAVDALFHNVMEASSCPSA